MLTNEQGFSCTELPSYFMVIWVADFPEQVKRSCARKKGMYMYFLSFYMGKMGKQYGRTRCFKI